MAQNHTMETNDKVKPTEKEVAVLEERIYGFEKLFNEKLKHYRNIGGIILIFITAIGVGTIFYLITVVVTNFTETKLNQILTQEYVDKKIHAKSAKTINALIQETEKTARNVMEKYSTINDWKMRATEAEGNKEYQKAVECYDRIIEKLEWINDEEKKNREYYINYFYRGLSLLLTNNYMGAFDSLKHARTTSGEYVPAKGFEANRYYLICIAQSGIGVDLSKTELKLGEFKKQNLYPDNWLLKLIYGWQERQEIDGKVRTCIHRLYVTYIGPEKASVIMENKW